MLTFTFFVDKKWKKFRDKNILSYTTIFFKWNWIYSTSAIYRNVCFVSNMYQFAETSFRLSAEEEFSLVGSFVLSNVLMQVCRFQSSAALVAIFMVLVYFLLFFHVYFVEC